MNHARRHLHAGHARLVTAMTAIGVLIASALIGLLPTAAAATTSGPSPSFLTPSQLAQAYNLPSGTGAHHTVAVIRSGDDPTLATDLATYRSYFGLPALTASATNCTSGGPCLTVLDRSGNVIYPVGSGAPQGSDDTAETAGDVDMVSAICPTCNIVVVEASNLAYQFVGPAWHTAVAFGARYISNSFLIGSSREDSYSANVLQEIYQLYFDYPGVVITDSTSDGGYGGDGVPGEFPNVLPDVVSAGGTTLTADAGSPRGYDETAWSGGGSLCATVSQKEPWQTTGACPNRTETDLSAAAGSAAATYDSASGGWSALGGTSQSAPLLAAMYALAPTPGVNDNPVSYPYEAAPSDLNDITTGNNNPNHLTCAMAYICNAGPGYDGPTGMGTPNGVGALQPGTHLAFPDVTTDSVIHGNAYAGQLQIPGATGSVTYTQTGGGPEVSVSSTGAVTAASTVAAGVYVTGGTDVDSAGHTGYWTFTLDVGSWTSTTTSATVKHGSAYSATLAANVCGGAGEDFTQDAGFGSLTVDQDGNVTAPANLAPGTYHASGFGEDHCGDWGWWNFALTVKAGKVPSDFDGDGSSDLSVFRPSAGKWYVDKSSGGSSTVAWGNATDIPVPGDYDGDGTTDVAVYRPSSGKWLIQDSGGGTQTVAWGNATDIPVPGDYNGDGKTDVAVYRPSSGKWLIEDSGGGTQTIAWGNATDIPVPGDYNGDGKTDVAVYRPSSGKWLIQDSGGGTQTIAWGNATDIPVPGDYDSDGKTDIAVFRPSSGKWLIDKSAGGTQTVAFGAASDIPVPGDYNGDGKTDIAVFRASSGKWYVNGGATTSWGTHGDIPAEVPPATYQHYFAS
jgi:hypothetical protein